MALPSSRLSDAERPVAFFANGIGDAILTLPALRALTEIFPGRLTLLTHGRAGYLDLFRTLPTQRQLSIRSGTKCDWEREDIDALVSEVGDCDLFISLVAWHSPSLGYLLERLAPTKSIGYCESYDIRLPRDYSKHTAELIFDAVRAVSPGAKLRPFLAPPDYPPHAMQMAQAVRAGLGEGVRILTVHTETLAEKTWPAASVAAVLDRFLTSHTEYIAVLVNYAPYPLELADEANRRRLVAEGGLPLADALCLVHYSDCFLGVDSCMLHAADVGRVPSVGLFGPTDAHEFGFLVGPHVAIQAPSDVNQIGVECVLAALESLQAEPEQRTVWKL